LPTATQVKALRSARRCPPGWGRGTANRKEAETQAAEAAKQQTVQQDAAREEQLALFRKGFAACLEAKGYSVK
jgi:hypothetical protein